MPRLMTDREREILRLTALGLRSKEVAHILGISEQTIKNHLFMIRGKYGAANTAHLVALAITYGDIKLDREVTTV